MAVVAVLETMTVRKLALIAGASLTTRITVVAVLDARVAIELENALLAVVPAVEAVQAQVRVKPAVTTVIKDGVTPTVELIVLEDVLHA